MKPVFIPGLRDLFALQGVKQVRVAAELGIHDSVVSLWVRGKRGVATDHVAALAAVLGLTVAELTEGCTAAPVAAPVAPKAPVAAPVLPERKYGRRGQYRWKGNINPACHRLFRCGECVKDKSAESARQKWADGTFLRGRLNRYDNWSKQEIELVRRMAGAARPFEILEALRAQCRTARSLPALKKAAWVHDIPLGRAGC